MTRRESSKSRQRVIYQPTTAHCTRPQVFSLSQPIYESSRKSGEELLTFPIQGGAPIMHAVVMACDCRACKQEGGRERGRAQANMQIFYRTAAAAASRPSPKIKKLWNIGAAARITVRGEPAARRTETEAGSSRDRPNRPARPTTTPFITDRNRARRGRRIVRARIESGGRKAARLWISRSREREIYELNQSLP